MGPGGHELSPGTTWKERVYRPTGFPRVRGAGEDLTKSINTLPDGGHTWGGSPDFQAVPEGLDVQSHQEAPSGPVLE